MATAVAASSTFISTNDPIFNQIQPDYSACTLDDHSRWVISERYKSLDLQTKNVILLLWELGYDGPAQAIADCGKYGSVHASCKKKNAAQAYRHTCHLWIHSYCGRPGNLLRCWLRWRSAEVREAKQWGIEIHGPLGSNLWQKASKLGRWLKDRGISSTMRPVLSSKPRCESVRIVYRQDRSMFRDIVDHLHGMTKQAEGYSASAYYDATPTRVLEWMFSSHVAILESCAHVQAKSYIQWYRKQMTRTYGDFYKEISEDQYAALNSPEEREEGNRVARRCDCGECDGEMEVIPWQERHTQTVDEIEQEYKTVSWSSCYDPFRVRRISHKRTLMTDSTRLLPVPATSCYSPPG